MKRESARWCARESAHEPAFWLIPADDALPALRRLPAARDPASARAVLEALPRCLRGSTRLVRFAVLVAGRASLN